MVDDAEVNLSGRSLIVSRVSARSTWLALACLTMFIGLLAISQPSTARAEDTVWICKPGQSDDLCAGSISTKAGNPPATIGFTRPDNPPVDCFYVYPTVSEQATPNANLDKDPEVKRVVVQQARMFSRVCDVYAPMYRQDTNPGVYTERTEVAYQSALSAWKDYLANYNDGRGVILVGHSQGSATLARLVDEEIDPKPAVRKQLVGAILPGANIHVPKNELVGGMFSNVPACSEVGQYGCLVAYSMFNGTPADDPPFADVGSGYWAYDMPRPDRNQFEVVCTNPAELSGEQFLTPLVNMDYLLSPPADGVEKAFWTASPDGVAASCDREGTKHWLNVSFTAEADPLLASVIPIVASGNNWHVPEVNVAENNLVQIAKLQSDSYTKVVRLKARIAKLNGDLAKAKKNAASSQKKAAKLSKQSRKASGKRKAALVRKAKAARRKAASDRQRVGSLTSQIAKLKKQLP